MATLSCCGRQHPNQMVGDPMVLFAPNQFGRFFGNLDLKILTSLCQIQWPMFSIAPRREESEPAKCPQVGGCFRHCEQELLDAKSPLQTARADMSASNFSQPLAWVLLSWGTVCEESISTHARAHATFFPQRLAFFGKILDDLDVFALGQRGTFKMLVKSKTVELDSLEVKQMI